MRDSKRSVFEYSKLSVTLGSSRAMPPISGQVLFPTRKRVPSGPGDNSVTVQRETHVH